MPKQRLSMRKIREILRLKHECNCSNREIGLSCNIGSSTVSDYLQRTRMAGLSWPLPDEINDTALEELLFPIIPRTVPRFIPDFQEVHKELQSRKNVTLNLLWQEYKEQHPDGYQYSWCVITLDGLDPVDGNLRNPAAVDRSGYYSQLVLGQRVAL